MRLMVTSSVVSHRPLMWDWAVTCKRLRKDKSVLENDNPCAGQTGLLPVFLPTVTLLEVGVFTYYALQTGDREVPANSPFIYRPDKRLQVWRFVFYMVLHAGWVHLFLNVLIQLVVGVPLELGHGPLRVAAVYMAGVLAGSLGTSVFDVNAFLVGASGGVYALLAAHLANLLLNYSELELALLRLAALLIVAVTDVSFSLWGQQEARPGYVAHVTGALAGLTSGVLVLKHYEQRLQRRWLKQALWWAALGVYCGATLGAVLWNVFTYNTAVVVEGDDSPTA